MPSNAKIGYGCVLTRAGNAIAEITSITPPNLSADSVDVTNMGSADGYREFIQGLRDGGEVSIEGTFFPGDTDGQVGIISDFNNGTLQSFVLTFPTAMGATWTFSAIVTGFEGEIPNDDAITFSATLKISGKPALGVTASAGASAFVLRNAADDGEADAANYMPTFAIGTFYYTVTYTTQTSVRPRVTAVGHVIKIYVDGVYTETLSSGVSGSAITIGADATKQIRAEVYVVGQTPKNYYINASRIS